MTKKTRTWQPETPIELPRPTGLGWLRVIARFLVLFCLLFGGLAILLLVRIPERLICGARRPVTEWIAHWACGAALSVLGLEFTSRGTPMRARGAQVANHSSWIDIFALYRRDRVYFAAKSEVDRWPGIGLLSRSVGTLFIVRDPRQAAEQREVFSERLRLGQRLAFFPEGTSTDGTRVLPFKPTLFAAFFEDGVRQEMQIQPVAIRYHAPDGMDARFYCWFGDMDFASHMLAVLAAPRHGGVEVVYAPPLRVADFADRKALSAAAEAAVRQGHGGG